MSLIGFSSPYEHSMHRVANQPDIRAIDELVHHHHFYHHFPYWAHAHNQSSLSYGSPIGEVVNNHERYALTLDVSHFKPEEIKVYVRGNYLMIEGNHDEKTDQHGTNERSFIRKYSLPDDTNLDSIRTSLTHNGHLRVEAHKKTNGLTQTRTIPVTIMKAA
ncbi:hypothetical protein PENTCL1PPCAC_23306 [Pristionchus entomophagus]|uniref:SHSP domain-containing protein n=1 Tax=Pristionchus entomophagus TaxID=358040 RepID=A0AAV5U308_9BILA|nr:hypothetical protein PENTCL1PPCAC_23306 [Pristionchus entomophagus]